MLKQLTISLLGLSLVSFCVPASAQNTTNNQQCEAALNAAKEQLISDRQMWITGMSASHAQNSYDDFPYDHPIILFISISGTDADDVMNSPRLLTSITQTITSGCSQVGLITYNLAETDWTNDFGLIGNQVQEFQCLDPDDPNQRRWGYTTCL